MKIRLRSAIGNIPDCGSVAGIMGKQRFVEQRMRHVLRDVTLLRYRSYQAQRSRYKDYIYVAYLRQQCRNSKFCIFYLLV